MKRILTTLSFCTLVYSVNAQAINRIKLDSLFNTLASNNMDMGSIAISKHGKVIYQRAFGNAVMSPSDTVKATGNTEYRLGSITKMFTATLIFQLIEAHKLSLTGRLSSYFPNLPNADHITISNLLYHRSGLADFTKNTDFDRWSDKPQTHEQLLERIAKQKPDFEPNAAADYNNSNYLLLGYIIENICKKPYKEVLSERIIKTLSLSKTYYGETLPDIKKEAISYKYMNNQWHRDKAVWLDNFSGCGAIISTPADMLKFMEALFTGKLISKSSLSQMQTFVDDYGMGMFGFDFDTHKGFGHNGKTEGFASSLTYYPADGLAIAYCTNAEVYHKANVLNGVLSICFNKPYTIPTFKPIELKNNELDVYIGTYTAKVPAIQVAVKKAGNHLQSETHGQVIDLIALGNNEFFSKAFGFFFDFDLAGKKMIIKDVEANYVLDKQ
ncbi:serine hydrolase domain-containing protein [Mucilaginibacter ximonensis]|uniref:Serine hydrolase domain-containing protein n=1 Tax=Mucilaginibacter ximonensis TaxID=538021 RepID=A0ABW5Y8B2_9SPHI